MQTPSNSAKRLAKNSVLMYIRMFVLMGIGFLLSRVLLQKLGVSDFGVYSLVGSIVAMFSSMSGLFVTATQRFLNYEMGRGNDNELKKIYNTSIIVNIIVSIMFALCVEILGLWFIYNEINVPPERLLATKVVLHFSVATSVVYILTTPLDAVIIAHEKMSAYAYLTILDHLLKLFIIYLLFLSKDRLIFYAFLLFAVSFLMRIIYEIYCRRNFPECRYEYVFDKKLLKNMASFAGWQLCGTTSYTLTHNGLNMLLNIFGGTLVNAARGIAYQAFAAVNQFIINLQLVLSPLSTKLYASENTGKMFQLFFFSSKLMFLTLNCVVLPIIFFTEEILIIWLGTIPDYSVIFIRLLMIYSLLRALHSPVDTLLKSVGKIKQYQITESIVLSIPLLLSYLALKANFELYWVFIFVIILEFVNTYMILLLAHREAHLDLSQYCRKVFFPIIICFICELALFVASDNSVVNNLITLLLSELLVIMFIYQYSFTSDEKQMVIQLIKQFGKKRKLATKHFTL